MRGRGRTGTLGTFGGVFTPSLLTILGVILFLRTGFVVGSAGLGRALLILALAKSISVLTSLSLAAIATNRKVRGGGVYYLISRSLGIEYGGALGLLIFAAQAISVAFYCVGFGEVAASLLPAANPRLVAAGAALVLGGVAFLGADLATRLQYAIMAVLTAGLVSFFAGGLALGDGERLAGGLAAPAGALGFWPLFALFFPAVTGFTQGVNMSGDLRDPSRSLPGGTLAAVGLSAVVYVGAMLVFAAALPGDVLRGDYAAMRRVAALPALVDAGLMAAALSSALASFLGAPRILQALAADGVFPLLAPFARGHGAEGNPRRGVLLVGAIALATIVAGNLNAIASVISMFFLISYGLLNYATYVEATGASPSFRPRFRFFHRRASLAGTLLCVGAMLAIDPLAGVVALALLGAVHQYLKRTAIPTAWRDSRWAYRFRRVKDGLQGLAEASEAPRDWQPHVLVFTAGAERRERILRFASWITGGSGLVAAVQLLEGEGSDAKTRQRCEHAEAALRGEIEEHGLDAFPLVVAAPDLGIGASTLVQTWGVGPIRANTVLLNWFQDGGEGAPGAGSARYARVLRNALRIGRNVVVLHSSRVHEHRLEDTPPQERRIDVWWWEDGSSRLALLFAYLMTRSATWDEATIRLLAPAAEGTGREAREAPRRDARRAADRGGDRARGGRGRRRHRRALARRHRRLPAPAPGGLPPRGSLWRRLRRARRAAPAGGAGGRGGGRGAWRGAGGGACRRGDA